MSSVVPAQRVVSGMRATGRLHLGHYHGVLKNWARLQHEYECFFFVADWHGLTTEYENPGSIEQHTWDLVVDWLAAGVNPGSATLFVQSQVPEHAELHLLLSMITPLSWLERVPTYKDQQEKLKEKDLGTYGFLGYPLLQAADILIYRAGQVPVGADQVAHVELTREVARRFNHLYGREPGFEEAVAAAIKKMGKKQSRIYLNHRRQYQEQGDESALETARALVQDQQNITLGDKERLYGDLEGGGKVILPEPQALLTPASRMPGLDGQKMSKSYGNFISLREEPGEVESKIRRMPTDPARVRRSDPGDPENCPVWEFHKVYSDDATRIWVREGCTSAGIGCLDCKKPVIEAVQEEVEPIRKRAEEHLRNPDLVRSVLSDGCEEAREQARATLEEVRAVMGLHYR
ncbi:MULTISPECIES: tryptophan--tRNA ligase [Alloalcanivorax]|uniref:Tryptophan--tRNA ligase n=3 Tax=Alloalcanivorax TaxID=3020832 RepID=K0CDU3_ALCDB|nr:MULTISPECIES: tryptophan--tRNA ligase [Alloalcanivorax]AFT70595.1 Tryptophanyl-tRNA synthetase, putative [Alloalcanivorax dieselolei B5]WOA29496.1 tryptophan--tRNA ligase [Alloalcanivorax xenomutans]WOD26475.1 tryptophan--tRNA ligase [Alloalcanivorax xenomutans]SOB97963.1 tryptophanyl-tRNA synthetase [Alloalcanivorax xenomutans]GGJ85546.1 tryptophan--tRNA ligase [Alloalcanivorax dieselolei]